MGWRMKSMSEDNIDVYTHTWSVALFLFLAFLTFVIPVGQGTLPEFQSSCWFPDDFEPSQIDYTNTMCNVYLKNFLINRDNQQGNIILNPDPNLPPKTNASYQKNGDNDERQKSFLRETAPVTLFLFALALRLPHLLWSIFTMCANSVNIDQTLQSAGTSEYMDTENRRKLQAGLIHAFMESVRSRKKTSTLLYMLMKFLMTAVVIIEIIIIMEYNTPSDKIVNPVYDCFYEINQKGKVHNYTSRCLALINLNESSSWVLSGSYIMVLCTLVILAIANILNTLMWLLSFCGQSSRTKLGLHQNAPLDLVFLIRMARANMSVGLATALAEMASFNSDYGNKEPFEIKS